MKIPRIVIGGTHSGVGKTSVAVGIMGALTRRGRKVQGFKMGPDFLDTSFHATVTGRPSRNLDSWMMPKRRIPSIFASGCAGADIAIIEGVMGVFDGIDGASEVASTSEVAKVLKAPVLLVIDAWGLAASAAAVVLGYKSLDLELKLKGVILNRVAGESHAKMCKDAITKHSRVPVLGAVPMKKDLSLGERHLGLIPATEMRDLKAVDALIDHVESHVDLDLVEGLAESADELPTQSRQVSQREEEGKIAIGVASDKAFNFYYQENLDRLRAAGARLEFFSPLEDANLPHSVSGLYIGGGYPEVFASGLASNHDMLESIASYAEDEMPVYAECGGLMYLTESIQDYDGAKHEMVGLFDAQTRMVKKLTLSYTLARTIRRNLLTNRGDAVKGHEYHFSAIENIPRDAKFAYTLKRGVGVVDRQDGWTSHNTLASYMHTNFVSDERMAKRFVGACAKYARK